MIKTFCAIKKLDGIDIDQNVINTAINWLSSRQRADGAIPDSNPVIHQEMNVGLALNVVHCVVWCGVLSCGVVGCGVVWCGGMWWDVVWCGVVMRCGVL